MSWVVIFPIVNNRPPPVYSGVESIQQNVVAMRYFLVIKFLHKISQVFSWEFCLDDVIIELVVAMRYVIQFPWAFKCYKIKFVAMRYALVIISI